MWGGVQKVRLHPSPPPWTSSAHQVSGYRDSGVTHLTGNLRTVVSGMPDSCFSLVARRREWVKISQTLCLGAKSPWSAKHVCVSACARVCGWMQSLGQQTPAPDFHRLVSDALIRILSECFILQWCSFYLKQPHIKNMIKKQNCPQSLHPNPLFLFYRSPSDVCGSSIDICAWPLRSQRISMFSVFLLCVVLDKHISILWCLIYHSASARGVLEQLDHHFHTFPQPLGFWVRFSEICFSAPVWGLLKCSKQMKHPFHFYWGNCFMYWSGSFRKMWVWFCFGFYCWGLMCGSGKEIVNIQAWWIRGDWPVFCFQLFPVLDW